MRFEKLRHEHAGAMAAAGVSVVSIERVGSTAVPELAAKPVIDCDIVVTGRTASGRRVCWPTWGSRRWASSGSRCGGHLRNLSAWPTNTYVVVSDSLPLRNHLAVRDILRADPGLRSQDAAVKRRAGVVAADIDEYGKGTNAMVQRILAAPA